MRALLTTSLPSPVRPRVLAHLIRPYHSPSPLSVPSTIAGRSGRLPHPRHTHIMSRYFSSSSSSSSSNRPRDIDQFLAAYPGQADEPKRSANLEFYRNEREMMPDRLRYEEFMKRFERDYEELEANHGYIQWLFPIREHGVNPQAQPLQPHEIDAMSKDPEVLARILRSYKMMLAFYGIDYNGGNLRPANDAKARFSNLHHRPHNLLRLTRILKHISELPALQAHAAPLLLFLTAAHSEGLLDLSEGTLHGGSLDRWWSNVFRDEEERRGVRELVRARGGRGEKKWGWADFEEWMRDRGQGEGGKA